MTFDEAHATAELITDRRMSDRRVKAKARAVAAEAVANDVDVLQEDEQPVQGERRKVERRRQIDPTTCERDYGDAEVEFMNAMDNYKRRSGRQFPTWSEVLEVLHSLGYRQVAEPVELEL